MIEVLLGNLKLVIMLLLIIMGMRCNKEFTIIERKIILNTPFYHLKESIICFSERHLTLCVKPFELEIGDFLI